ALIARMRIFPLRWSAITCAVILTNPTAICPLMRSFMAGAASIARLAPAMPAGFATVSRPSSLQRDPVTDRQTANALAGRREDRVAQGRRERRYARLADAARRDVDPLLDDVHPGIGRGLVDAHESEVVEVALLHSAVFERDLAVARERQPHHGRAF